ncbi:MAG: carboxylesterase [Candidatus Omnitrophica bacterium]|nr:carboxylesterase [Candidatus Omnitrophota bacterium]
MQDFLETIEKETGADPRFAVIWLHGLGADGHDFEPIIDELKLPAETPVRFIFPHAPVRNVGVNGGMPTRAWYDIVDMDLSRDQDEPGLRDSEGEILALIDREVARGIPADRIFLAGFSQGGAVALHTGLRLAEPLAGVIALSCYVMLPKKALSECRDACLQTPVFMAHGKSDEVVPFDIGESSRELLESLGLSVQWQEYPMGHAVCPEEIEAISEWIQARLKDLLD